MTRPEPASVGNSTRVSVRAHQNVDHTSNSCARRIPLVVEFHPALPDISGILRKRHPLFMLFETMRKVVPDVPFVRWRQPPSLKKQLTRAKLLLLDPVIPEASGPCGGSRCLLCTRLCSQRRIVCKTFSVSHQCRNANTTCDSANVVNCISCPTCVQYSVCRFYHDPHPRETE